MIDKNTYKHFGLAFIGALVITLIFNEMWASFVMLTAIITWELCQAQTLINDNKIIRWQSIAWDVFTGIMGTLVGCVIAVWIKS